MSEPAPASGTTAAPAPGTLKTFGDWAVACDNVRRCAMASLGAEDGDFPEYTVELARLAGPTGGYEIALSTQRDASPIPAAFVIDGRSLPFRGDALSGAGAQAIAAAVANARLLVVTDGRGTRLATLSLKGASAALRYIDAAQGRAGSVTATVARGAAPASTVPAAAAAPIVTVPAAGGTAATPSAAQLREMNRLARCEMPEGAETTPELAALGAGATLVILPCSAGAYNVSGALFVLRDGRIAAARTDAPAGFTETGADAGMQVPSVVNGTFDGGLLTSYAKARGLGDCGVAQSFAWDGTRFRLVEQSAMDECRGNPNFLRTWHARVERR